MIKFVSLNIEMSKHLDLFETFFHDQKPDVVCLQEVFESDLDRLTEIIGSPPIRFEPMTRLVSGRGTEVGVEGIVMFSRLPLVQSNVFYYFGQPGPVPIQRHLDSTTYNNKNLMVIVCDMSHGDEVYRFATTHFTWTPNGKATDEQRRDVKSLLSILATQGEFVLSGDFNAPRGAEIFSELSSRYKDNIPMHYATSLDVTKHVAGEAMLKKHAQEMGVPGQMVDGLFTTPGYIASDVELVSGVSDHCAVVAHITKS